MRVLRTTIWADLALPPLTTVMRDCDTSDSLESVRETLIRGPGGEDIRPYVHYNLFDVPDETDVMRATFLAHERIDGERERNCAILFFWTVKHLPVVSEKGTVLSDKPAPLTAVEIARVYEQIILHPLYKHHRIVAGPSEDGKQVEVRDGTIYIDNEEA